MALEKIIKSIKYFGNKRAYLTPDQKKDVDKFRGSDFIPIYGIANRYLRGAFMDFEALGNGDKLLYYEINKEYDDDNHAFWKIQILSGSILSVISTIILYDLLK